VVLVAGRATFEMRAHAGNCGVGIVWDVTEPIRRLINQGAGGDEGRLADPDTPLEALASVEGGTIAS
jgi:hypothetical protein